MTTARERELERIRLQAASAAGKLMRQGSKEDAGAIMALIRSHEAIRAQLVKLHKSLV